MEELRMEIILPKGSDKLMIKGVATPWMDFGILLEVVEVITGGVQQNGESKIV